MKYPRVDNSPIYFDNLRDRYKGSEFLTSQGYVIRVLEYRSSNDVLIEFVGLNYITTARMSNIKTGKVGYPFHPNKYGAYFGIGPYTNHNIPKVYDIWYEMFTRVYNENDLNKRNNTYKGLYICQEWFNYQAFAEWYINYSNLLNPDFYNDYQIDKDILQWGIEGNHYYSPQTCCLIPSTLNMALANHNVERISEPDLPVGVTDNGKGTRRSFSINISMYGESSYLGTFNDPMEAFSVYKFHKEKYIKELADYYFSMNCILKDVYDALYRIEIKPFENK